MKVLIVITSLLIGQFAFGQLDTAFIGKAFYSKSCTEEMVDYTLDTTRWYSKSHHDEQCEGQEDDFFVAYLFFGNGLMKIWSIMGGIKELNNQSYEVVSESEIIITIWDKPEYFKYHFDQGDLVLIRSD